VKKLRKDFLNNKNSNQEENFADKPWVTKTPYDVRNAALNDVVNAYTSNLAKEDNKNFYWIQKREVIQLRFMQNITNKQNYKTK
jgi:hypothetical protein